MRTVVGGTGRKVVLGRKEKALVQTPEWVLVISRLPILSGAFLHSFPVIREKRVCKITDLRNCSQTPNPHSNIVFSFGPRS